MRVVMFGYQTWGHRTLQALLDSPHEVVTVVTHPKSEHAYERIWSDSVADLAAEHGVPVVIRDRPDDEELFQLLKDADPDIIVANNWRTWIPPRVYNLPRHGTLNVHDSLLPKYAGFSPIIWALLNGESEVGVTGHLMDEELDAGDIVLQRSVPVGPDDTATDLFHKTVDLITPVTVGSLDLIASGRTEFTPQDRSQATFFHKRAEDDIRIDWNWQAEELHRLIRAQSAPYPAAFTHHKGKRLEILAAVVSEKRYGGTPGRIFYREGEGVVIVAGADARTGRNHGLAVTRVRTEDGRELPAAEYFTRMGGYLTDRP
ncbi:MULTISPECIES: methionyl-tRNA formyltransferase [Streptomyces]|uniref:methionyl-tRNA formyltransferase n=1 Tax=Streptomyces TaxID=1883 RepID=UPI001CCC7934|nr:MULTISPECIES: methionyl-tRNA formyltransferase [Streptomyces]MBZ6255971.1 methionyl-tRNA formyltransferase [Streptomyces olivaceus]WFB84567.1 methionyl-tRNA formyltransferase [Streptomyces olivaceus]WGK49813.1 methionyl-tRNA formyltransferase [Streptomyces sp. B146]GHI93321.1 methionyl-tRNA formyltransferase [Streptomyces olivaceus]